jgi:hypothetical protein
MKRMDLLISKIKSCQTSKELDFLRADIVQAINSGADFTELQSAFIKQKNKLQRNGHNPITEGYSLLDVIRESKNK